MMRFDRRRAAGFTLLEMLTTVAALVILLGLMVSLARHVRSSSSEVHTRQLLGKLEKVLADHPPGSAPQLHQRLGAIPLLSETSREDDVTLQARAAVNSKGFVSACHDTIGRTVFNDLPLSLYDAQRIRDAWGTPVAYMPAGAPNVNIKPQNRAFFVSAGPDRRFSTVVDNLYSYERGWDRKWD